MTDILTEDTVYELSIPNSTGVTLFAYGLATKKTVQGTPWSQVQRWLIFTQDLAKQAPPHANWNLLPTADTNWKPCKTPTLFDAQVRSVFTPGKSYFYVIANCFKQTGVAQMDPQALGIPPFDDGFQPQARIARPVASEFQPDVGNSQLFTAAKVVGHLQVFFKDQGHSNEFWALSTGYKPGGPDNVVWGRMSQSKDFANLLNKAFWDSTCTLVTTSCTYYAQAPRALVRSDEHGGEK